MDGDRFESAGDTSKVYLFDGKSSLKEIYSESCIHEHC